MIPGQLAFLRVKVRNESTKIVKVRLQRLTRLGLIHDQPLRIEVRNEKGRQVDIRTHKISAIPPPVVDRKLKPKEETALEFDLYRILTMSMASGRYTLRAHYRSKEFTVSSKAISIVIKRPSREDQQAIRLYLSARRTSDDDTTIKALRKLLRKYPKASVVDRANELLADRLVRAGRTKEAVSIWRKMLEVRKTHRITVRWKLAMQLAVSGQLAAAIATLEPVKEGLAQKQCKKWEWQLKMREAAAGKK